MKNGFVLLLITLLCSVGCQNQTVESQYSKNQNSIVAESAKYIDLLEFCILEDGLAHKGYTFEKQLKSHSDLSGEEKTVEFAVIRQGTRKVKTFDLLEHPLSVIDFGLFGFLGNNEKQIFISQTAPRSGNHWIISLEPEFRVIFNSSEFNISDENFQAIDLDRDGVYELSFANYISLKLNSKTLAESMPTTEIIFKFNPSLNQYLPANPQFANHLLRDVDEQTKLIKRDNRDAQLADILNITLKYIYAGKDKEAWEIFEKHYDFEDKEIKRNAIKDALEKDVIYKSLKKIYDQNKLRK